MVSKSHNRTLVRVHGRVLGTGKVKLWNSFNEKLGKGVGYLYSCTCICRWPRAVFYGIQIPSNLWLTWHTENSFRKPGAVLQQRNRHCLLRTKSHQDLYTDTVKKLYETVFIEVCGQAESRELKNLLRIQILWLHSRLTKQETRRV